MPYGLYFLVQQPAVGQSLNNEISRSHNNAPQSVGLPWTSDKLVTQTST